nr:uncharacterized protein LOC105846997 [Hydra vulgaris]
MLFTFLTYTLLAAMFETAPLIYQPCPFHEHDDPTRVLKILLENFNVFNSTIKDLSKSNQNHENPKNSLVSFHTFTNKAPVCETKSIEVPDLIGKVTIPRKITEVTLVNSLNANKCKKVKKEIVYLEEEKSCNKYIDARMYIVKIRDIVVAYEHMI